MEDNGGQIGWVWGWSGVGWWSVAARLATLSKRENKSWGRREKKEEGGGAARSRLWGGVIWAEGAARSGLALAWLGGRSLASDYGWSWGWWVGWSWNEVGKDILWSNWILFSVWLYFQVVPNMDPGVKCFLISVYHWNKRSPSLVLQFMYSDGDKAFGTSSELCIDERQNCIRWHYSGQVVLLDLAVQFNIIVIYTMASL